MGRDVEVFTPFVVDSISHGVVKTYLDTTGRPTVTLRKDRCTENHSETIYVSCPALRSQLREGCELND